MSLKEIKEPKPFGVEYVPRKKRVKAGPGEPVYVGLVSEIPPGKAKAVDLEKFKVAVFNLDGEFYAVRDACPHAEYPLSKGVVRGEVVSCSSHNWQFHLKSGQCLRGDPEIKIRTFEVEVRGDEVWVRP